jgi:hypothetical protein
MFSTHTKPISPANSLAAVQLLGRLHSPLKRRHDTIHHIKALPQSQKVRKLTKLFLRNQSVVKSQQKQ